MNGAIKNADRNSDADFAAYEVVDGLMVDERLDRARAAGGSQ